MTVVWQVEPLGVWDREPTGDRRSSGVFRTSWQATLDLLRREVELLDPVGAVVLRVDAAADDIRRDGLLRARARVDFPGVAVAFTSASRGPLSFASDMYEQRYYNDLPGWQANVRGIALSLGALRAVDRHGATSCGEQYVGWRQIEAPAPRSESFTSVDAAARWIRSAAEYDAGQLAQTLPVHELYRLLARRMHPDLNGGQSGEWNRLDEARRLLEGTELW